jgi:hypothetical protein
LAICCRSRPAASRRVDIIATILERSVMQKILTQLGSWSRSRCPRRRHASRAVNSPD